VLLERGIENCLFNVGVGLEFGGELEEPLLLLLLLGRLCLLKQRGYLLVVFLQQL
jgi:hypothetical protein